MREVGGGRHVGQHRDHPAPAQREQRHHLVVVAAVERHPLADPPRELRHLREVAARLLHPHHPLVRARAPPPSPAGGCRRCGPARCRRSTAGRPRRAPRGSGRRCRAAAACCTAAAESRRASAPAASRAARASSATAAVPLPPTPATTGTRPPASSTTTSTARRCSAGVMAAASPVLPFTTSASVPSRRWKRTSSRSTASSTPSAGRASPAPRRSRRRGRRIRGVDLDSALAQPARDEIARPPHLPFDPATSRQSRFRSSTSPGACRPRRRRGPGRGRWSRRSPAPPRRSSAMKKSRKTLLPHFSQVIPSGRIGLLEVVLVPALEADQREHALAGSSMGPASWRPGCSAPRAGPRALRTLCGSSLLFQSSRPPRAGSRPGALPRGAPLRVSRPPRTTRTGAGPRAERRVRASPQPHRRPDAVHGLARRRRGRARRPPAQDLVDAAGVAGAGPRGARAWGRSSPRWRSKRRFLKSP